MLPVLVLQVPPSVLLLCQPKLANSQADICLSCRLHIKHGLDSGSHTDSAEVQSLVGLLAQIIMAFLTSIPDPTHQDGFHTLVQQLLQLVEAKAKPARYVD